MVRHLIQIDRPDQVDRTDKLFFHVPCQVASVEKLKLCPTRTRSPGCGRCRIVSTGLVGRSALTHWIGELGWRPPRQRRRGRDRSRSLPMPTLEPALP